jgi:hypothetical protein
MASTLNRPHLILYLGNPLRACKPLPHALFILAIHPLGVIAAQVNGTLEDARPLEMRGVEVRVRNDNGLEPALVVNKLDGRGVDEGDEIPEDVSVCSLDQDSALADAELFACGAGRCETGWEFGGCEGFGGDVVYAAIVDVGFKGVLLETLFGV